MSQDDGSLLDLEKPLSADAVDVEGDIPLDENSVNATSLDSKNIAATILPGTTLYRKVWFAFFLLGLFNNLSYVLVNSAAKSLADGFNAGNLIGVILWANIGFGILFRALNTWYFINYSYRQRIRFCLLLAVIGLVGVAVSVWINFWFAIAAITFIGCFSSFGESVLLGFLKSFHPELMGAWSSGTGMAGVAGTLLYLALYSGAGISNTIIFFSMLPFHFIYYVAFAYSLRFTHDDPSKAAPDRDQIALQITPTNSSPSSSNSSSNSSNSPVDETDALNGRNKHVQEGLLVGVNHSESSDDTYVLPRERVDETSMQRNVRVLRSIWSPATQLAAVYFLEYVASVGFASKANPKKTSHSWFEENGYEILAFCYQVGVLISRSSISFIQIKRIELLTFIQAGNFVLWFFQAWSPFMHIAVQCIAMVFVGLLGGAMYVNVFFWLVQDGVYLRKNDQELGINIAAIFINLGIVMAAVFQIIMFNTAMKGDD